MPNHFHLVVETPVQKCGIAGLTPIRNITVGEGVIVVGQGPGGFLQLPTGSEAPKPLPDQGR